MGDIFREIRGGLDGIKVIDIHSHLGSGGVWEARHLAHLVSYHWLSVELTRAKGERIQASPRDDPDGYMSEVVPYFPAVRNTVNHYALMSILRDLYGLQERTLTAGNWRDVDARVRADAGDPDRFVKVLDRCGIEKVMVGHDAPGMPHPTGRCVPYAYGEPMFAFEEPSHAEEIFGKGAAAPATLDELVAGIRERMRHLAEEEKARALHNWVRGTWVYRADVAAEEAAAIYERVAAGEDVGMEDRDKLMSFTADVTAEEAAKHSMPLQIFHGMISYTRAHGSSAVVHYNPRFLPALARHFWKHRETSYDFFFGTRTPSHEATSLARVYTNVSVSGAWWHGFSPTTLTEFFRDRLELLPNTAWNAFYSDGYMVEWVYGKLSVTKNRLAHALAGLVNEGFLAPEDAIDVAGRLLFDNPVAFYGLA